MQEISEAPGVWVSVEQAQLLRDMCVNATAQDAKTKIRIGETQLALEEQLNRLGLAAVPAATSRQQRRAQARSTNGRTNGNAPAQAPAIGDPA